MSDLVTRLRQRLGETKSSLSILAWRLNDEAANEIERLTELNEIRKIDNGRLRKALEHIAQDGTFPARTAAKALGWIEED